MNYTLTPATAAKLKELIATYKPGQPPSLPSTDSGSHLAILPCGEKIGVTPGDAWPYYDADAPQWINSKPTVRDIGSGKHFLIGLNGQPLSSGASYLAVAGPDVTLYGGGGQMRTRTLWLAIPNALDALSQMINFTRIVTGGATHTESSVTFKEGRTLKWDHATMGFVDDQNCWVKEII